MKILTIRMFIVALFTTARTGNNPNIHDQENGKEIVNYLCDGILLSNKKRMKI